MSGTVDAIKEKLDPQTLAQQAKETVSEVTSNVMEKAKETVHGVVEQASEKARDVMEQAKGTVHEVVQEAKETLPTLSANVAHRAVSGAVTEAKEAVGSAVSSARNAVGEAVDTARGAASPVVDMIRSNPIPAALIGIGLGWLWASNRRPRFETRRYRMREYETGYPSYYDEGQWGRGSSGSLDYSPEYEGAAASGVSTRGAAAELRSRAGEVAGQVQQRVSQVADQVQERVGQASGRVRETVSDLGSRAGEQARYATTCFQRTLDENPLMLGMVALGVGAAVGLMLPGTYREDRMMGPARDQLVETVQDTAQDLATRAQIVAEGALDAAKEEARNQGLAPESA
jgi:ElaB/YqjD/DUF883 family membrane-anchored ribosome-binding protein